MYSQTVHGMAAYNPYTLHDDSHLRQRSSPMYSYSQAPRPYMPYGNQSPTKYHHHYDGHHHHHHMSQHDDDFYLDHAAFTIVPTVPTPEELTRYEYGRTPSGKVLVTAGNQTVEIFTGVMNAPPCYME
ncbi:hypothetical protein SDRG_05892 [Saprolegnia diclina VS20]|uniref:Uncharacterized protein n=1 Tax=Saprolegnia diclina (strain VS20) TaxID=1156394 RepID=T0QRA8_SAPDV|nr:hypothetical protein SDRG_05892 [Saprolegnia diclina VS20]EQC36435.1 hypothetical protein SDRG_05892 [Saprolegnia diclina VS20]|eukprot:XP_008609856.1 hypothetical protein SDRG_05892 [Saprolegnia diclina VS20]